MNTNLIIFSGLMTALVGTVLVMAATEITPDKYEGKFSKKLDGYYLLIGTGIGFTVGAGEEYIKELKKPRNRS